MPKLGFFTIVATTMAARSQGGGNHAVANAPTFDATSCLDDHIINILNENNIPGANVAVLRKGQLAYEQGYGTRDAPGVSKDEERPVLPHTPFRIASISKTITSLTVLLLAQEGSIDIDDVVFSEGGVLHSMTEGHPDMDIRISNITVRHLLRHAAGFTPLLDGEDPLSDPMLSSRFISSELGIPGPASCVDTIDFMMDIPLIHSPGDAGIYSNFGYCVLGRVIEAVTGMDYPSAAWKWLLDPAGVDEKEMYQGKTRLQDIPPTEAEYYAQGDFACEGPSLYSDDTDNVTFPYCAAFVTESADALGAWVASARQLVRIVSSVSPPHCQEEACLLEQYWRQQLEERPPYYPSNSTWWMGLGWIVRPDDGVNSSLTWLHPGGLPGTSTFLVSMGDQSGYAFAVLLNGNNETGLVDYSNFTTAFEATVECVTDDEWPVEFFEASSAKVNDSAGSMSGLFETVAVLSMALAFSILWA